MKPVTAILIGAGARGWVYAEYANAYPEQLRIVAIAEPHQERREHFAATYAIPAHACYDDWKALLFLEKCADVALICTMDALHYDPCMQAIKRGYHVLVEKPMSTSLQQCIEMERAAREKRVTLAVCHVLRYTPFYSKIKEVLDNGAIGSLQVVEQTEHVCYWHHAHSFVRGNWRKATDTAPMILSKCCHDLDIFSWLVNAPCQRVSSFGSLGHFTPTHAPQEAPMRCLENCSHKEDCLYYAPKLYLTENTDWPTNTISVDMSMDTREQALRTGPYGRCVYHCDNDVVDHQVVAMEFAGGIIATLTMTAFSPRLTRTLRLMGTAGILEGDMECSTVTLHRFGEKPQTFDIKQPNANAYGHGGGDVGLMADFVQQVRGRGECRTDAAQSLQSHRMAFAAEQSRLEGRTVML